MVGMVLIFPSRGIAEEMQAGDQRLRRVRCARLFGDFAERLSDPPITNATSTLSWRSAAGRGDDDELEGMGSGKLDCIPLFRDKPKQVFNPSNRQHEPVIHCQHGTPKSARKQ
jgi:hypothetical protein